MKSKLIMRIMLALLLIGMLAFAFNSESVKAISYIIPLSISPSTIIGPPPDIGENFTVGIYIENVTNLMGWTIGLAWNPSILNCTSWTTLFNTEVMGPIDNYIARIGTINNDEGVVSPPYAYVLFSGYPAKSGSDFLAQVEFQVLAYGFTWINFTQATIRYGTGVPHLVEVTNGKVQISPPAVGGIWIPVNKLELLAPYIGLTILLVAAVVTVGYVKKRKRHTKINS